jgi:hypothetical protein
VLFSECGSGAGLCAACEQLRSAICCSIVGYWSEQGFASRENTHPKKTEAGHGGQSARDHPHISMNKNNPADEARIIHRQSSDQKNDEKALKIVAGI